MKAKALAGCFLIILFLTEACVIYAQHGEINNLRAGQDRITTQMAVETKSSLPAAGPDNTSSSVSITPELLRLRGEVTRLEARRRELASVSAQNASLRTQLASRGTNAATGVALPPGYVRAADAKFVGYGSPENTIQSLLWAVNNHDGARFLEAMTPETARHLSGILTNDFFPDASEMIGMRIASSRQLEDGSIEAKIEVMPREDPEPVTFRQINGEWKMSIHFDEVQQ